MEHIHQFSLTKKERLCSKRLIDCLFDGKGKSFSNFPIRVVFKSVPRDTSIAQVSVLISVSKRRFKHAVNRNRVKRQIREAYRKNKHTLTEVMQCHTEENLLVGFLWLSDQLHKSNEVENKLQHLLLRISEQIKKNPTKGIENGNAV